MTNVMVKTCLNQKIIKNSNLIQAMKNSVCRTANVIRRPIFPQFPNCGFNKRHDNREVTLIELYESRICPNIYRMFRSVDWTHDMINVKWQWFILHERKLCALTNAPPAQSTQTGQWLPTLFHVNFHANCSSAQVYVLHPRQFKFAPYKLQATIIFAGITTHWAPRRIFCKIFCVSDDDKCYGESMSWPEKSKSIQAFKNSVCPKAKVIRRPNSSESRICPNIYRMFRSVDWTHDMIIVKWHLFIWHERQLCALTNAPPVQCTQTGQWLSTLFHANCSAAQVYVLHSGQFIFALSCRRRPFLQVLQSSER